jgi:hypothetical protein
MKEEIRQWQKINAHRMTEHAACLDATVLPLNVPSDSSLKSEEISFLETEVPSPKLDLNSLTDTFTTAARTMNRVILARRTLKANVVQYDSAMADSISKKFRITPPESSVPLLAALANFAI